MNDETPKIKPGGLPPARELPVVKELDSLADDIIEAMPDVSQDAIEAQAGVQTPETPAAPESGPAPGSPGPSVAVDVDGNSFNPEIHKTGPDGKPTLSRLGKLIKKPGRKRGYTVGGQSTIAGVPGSTGSSDELPPLTPAQRQQAAYTGRVSASLLINVSMMIGGEDFAPRVDAATGIDEKLALESGFTDYFIATRKTDLPPGVALCCVVGMYILPRFTQPKVQNRIKTKWQKVSDWYQGRKARKQAEKGKANGTQPDSGNDRKRQNDTGQVSGAELQT